MPYPHLTDEVLDLASLLAETEDERCGALAVFGGTVRIDNEGQQVDRIDYSAYEPLAVSTLKTIEQETKDKFGVQQCRLVHRTGKLGLGELSVLVVVRAGHRPEAFEAARWAIDTLKQRVPVWKQEYYADGSSEYLQGNEIRNQQQ
ncbi:MAG: molybdenum cofactor biosynthesis protein MoaE [Nevskiales bacterium]